MGTLAQRLLLPADQTGVSLSGRQVYGMVTAKVKSEGAENVPEFSDLPDSVPATGQTVGSGAGGHMIVSTEDAWAGAQEEGTC